MRTLDPDRYRECMAILGLEPQAGEDAIREAYRKKAKKWHPDKYSTPAEKGVATKRIKRLNNARDYVLRHRDSFTRREAEPAVETVAPEASSPDDSEEDRWIMWLDVFPDHELLGWLLLPITIVWHLAFAVVVVPVLFVSSFRSKRWFEMGAATEWWIRIGPHLVLLLFSLTASGTFENVWFWSAFVIVVGAEVAAHITGWWIQRSNRSDVEVARRSIESADATR